MNRCCVAALALVSIAGLSACGSSGQKSAFKFSKAQKFNGQSAHVDGAIGFVNKDLRRDGAFFFSGQPDIQGMTEAKSLGVRTVINLRTMDAMSDLHFSEERTASDLGMTYVSFPVTIENLNGQTVDEFAQIIAQSPGPVLIHGGVIDEAGGLWAAYLNRHQGFSVGDAIARANRVGLLYDATVEASLIAMGEPGPVIADAEKSKKRSRYSIDD